MSDIWMERFGVKMLGKIVSACQEYPWLQPAAPIQAQQPLEMMIKVCMCVYVHACVCVCVCVCARVLVDMGYRYG